MASTPFSLPNKLFSRQFASIPPPQCPSTLRVSASRTASFYDVLGIHAGASHQEVKSAYRELARTLHPDVAPKCGGGATADAFMQVQAAYATLSDPEKRAVYDKSLHVGAATSGGRYWLLLLLHGGAQPVLGDRSMLVVEGDCIVMLPTTFTPLQVQS